MRSEQPETGAIGSLAFVPGLAHLALGRLGRGSLIMLFSAAVILVMAWRWDRFVGGFSTPFFDRWLASLFLIALLLGTVWYSRRDARRIAAATDRARPGRSPWKVAMRRFRRNRLAVASIYVILAFYILAALAPIIAPYDPEVIPDVMTNRFLPPSKAHLFGTDVFGRDLFSRALYGARVSLSIGLLAMIIATTIGTLYGSTAAYFGGVVDSVLMRILDIWIAFPTFYLMLLLVGVFEARIPVLVLILGLTAWPGTARFIRGEILALKNREFAESARAIGLPPRRVIFKHLIPNALSPVLVTAALSVAGMIGAEAGLSFLGLGIKPPTPSWGNMVSAGQDSLLVAWWVAFFPGGLLTMTLLSFALLADGLRDALDPKALMQRYV